MGWIALDIAGENWSGMSGIQSSNLVKSWSTQYTSCLNPQGLRLLLQDPRVDPQRVRPESI